MKTAAPMYGTRQHFFLAQSRSVRLAREFAVAVLAEWRIGGRAQDVRLCVSELASNAIAHGSRRGHGFLVRLTFGDGLLRVEVHDSRGRGEGGEPRVCSPGKGDVRGRGLLIVDAVADRWGVEGREPLGKVVWAEFRGARER